MGDFPPPPAAFAWVLLVLALVGLVCGVYLLITGLPLVRFGRPKQISTGRAGRLLGLALLLDSCVSILIAQFINLMSQHIEPPRWSGLVFLPLILVVALQWYAYRCDRQPKTAPQ